MFDCIASKLDKLELTRLELSSNKIQDFASNYDELIDRVSVIELKLQEANERQKLLEGKVDVLEKENEGLKKGLNESARKIEVERISQVLERVEKTVDGSATRKEVAKLDKTQELISDTMTKLTQTMVDSKKSSKRSVDSLAKKLMEFVSRETLDKEVSTTAIVREMSQSIRELEKSQALSKTVDDDLLGMLHELQTEKDAIESKVQLALRFIEWFSDRDDAYELKQQLRNSGSPMLSLSHLEQQPNSREPFKPLELNTNQQCENTLGNSRASLAGKRLASIRSQKQ